MTMPSTPNSPLRRSSGQAYRVRSLGSDVADYVLEDATGKACGKIQIPAELATPHGEAAIERFLNDLLSLPPLRLVG